MRRVGPADEALLRRAAEEVASDLRFAGLPVTQLGDSSAGPDLEYSGAGVFYDPFKDGASLGVFVTWNCSQELHTAAISGGDAAGRSIAIGGTAMDAMREAIKQILTVAGWGVDSESVGVHESSVKVFKPS